jgi:ABC-type dipeptide/oligopeptide/nickel transport system permease component
MSLLAYSVRRALVAIPMLLGVITLTFVLVHLAPGDPAYYLAGDGGTPAYYALIRQKFGLDRALPEQLARYLWTAAQGDLGRSLQQGQPVVALIMNRLPATLLLVGTALLASSTIGVLMGAWAAPRASGFADRALLGITALGSALPVFWTGLLLALLFSLWLGWFPVQGMLSPRGSPAGWARAADMLRHLVLPATALAVQPLAVFSRLMRVKMLEALAEPYILTARAKGLCNSRIMLQAARNAVLPVVTVIGGHAGALVTGAVLTETVFAWPGLGRLALDATLSRDYPVVMGVVVIASVGTAGVNLLTDLVYAAIDPRITYA